MTHSINSVPTDRENEDTQSSQVVYLKNYKTPDFWVESLDLTVELEDSKTVVTAVLKIKRNPESDNKHSKPLLFLNGEELKLLSLTLDEQHLEKSQFEISDQGLTIFSVPEEFTLKTVTEIHPEKNTELSGLYLVKKLFCTQCEAVGFRRITYFLDRPDVMTHFKTTIVADKTQYPVLLSNGNCVDKGEVPNTNKHWVTWVDPFKKPCYLFALVAGDLVALEDHYLTSSGRLVALKIYVERENQDKCGFAMSALKRAMAWDEKTYGREYDLDIYMIVAVNDFNMGAMENKGLNIFNSKFILASHETATDFDFHNIDAVVGHEYFHNWSGNRVTCRDWFQLSLKEGLTVFREQQFMRDITKSEVSLIENTSDLRDHQFAEDSGPLAHPVRPESYEAIDNFYTSTVYEKGAEVIRMIQTLLGTDKFRKGMDLYFDRFDGQAVTIEDFVKAMEDASNTDLTQFKLWYSQAGTPEITFTESFDQNAQQYQLNLSQFCPPTPQQPDKKLMHIPIAIGLLDKTGKDIIETQVLSLTAKEQVFSFDRISEKPILSILRHFSAPVKIKTKRAESELAFLLARDSDQFARWDAGQQLTEKLLLNWAEKCQTPQEKEFKKFLKSDEVKKLISSDLSKNWLQAYQQVLENKDLDLALKTELLILPSLSYLIELVTEADVDALYLARKLLSTTLGIQFKPLWLRHYQENLIPGAYHYTQIDADKRGFKNLCLRYLMETMSVDKSEEVLGLCLHQRLSANNMTDYMAALSLLCDCPGEDREAALQAFYEKFKENALVMNKWFRIQALSELPDTLERVKALMKHPAFNIKNPNNVYSLVGAFAGGNLLQFHDISGSGYRFLADTVVTLNEINPQVAARMLNPLTQWRKFNKPRQEKMQLELKRIQASPKLSKDVAELVSKSL